MNLRKFLQLNILITPLLFTIMGTNVNAQSTPINAAAETTASRALTRLDELEGQIRTLTDRIERLEADLATQKGENQRLAKIIDENNAKMIAAEKPETDAAVKDEAPIQEATKVEPPKTEPVITPTSAPAPIVTTPAISAPIVSAAKKPAAPITSSLSNTKKIAPEKVAAVSVPPPAPVSAPITAPIAPIKKPVLAAPAYLANARLAIQNSDLDTASNNLKSLLENHKDAPEAAEARWLLGETYFVQDEWLDATKTYIDYLKLNKEGPRVPDILIRLASTYREMDVPDQRCKALKAYTSLAKTPSPALKARAQDEFAKGNCP